MMKLPRDEEILAMRLTDAKSAIRLLIRRGSMMALTNAGSLSPARGIACERGLVSALRLILEVEHGHGTPAYIAAVEAYREEFVLP